MRTLYEIITSAKDGEMPTHEECYWAMLVYDALFFFDHRNLQEELLRDKPTPELLRKMKADNSFKMYKNALDKSPKDWLGPNHDPANPECQKRRKIANKLFDKVISKMEKTTEEDK